MTPFFADTIHLAGRPVGHAHPVYIIAEAGVAHFGSLAKARALVDLAVAAGADAVKFQLFHTDALISADAPQWQERMRSKELPLADFQKIQDYCRQTGITFFATPHDEQSLQQLAVLNVPAFKIGSGELRNWEFMRQIAAHGRPVILSTGMYTQHDLSLALDTIRATGNTQVAVLHCCTQYPTPPADVNLRAMDTIRAQCRVITGYSDHTEGTHIPLAAVARGAAIVEKHISLDFHVPGAQDWKVSCGPDNFAEFVRQARAVASALGDGTKQPAAAERASADWACKSLVARRAIAAGEIITGDLLCAKRPGTGIAPAEQDRVIGQRAKVAIAPDAVLQWEWLTS